MKCNHEYDSHGICKHCDYDPSDVPAPAVSRCKKHVFDNHGHCMECHTIITPAQKAQVKFFKKQNNTGRKRVQFWVTPEEHAMINILLGKTS